MCHLAEATQHRRVQQLGDLGPTADGSHCSPTVHCPPRWLQATPWEQATGTTSSGGRWACRGRGAPGRLWAVSLAASLCECRAGWRDLLAEPRHPLPSTIQGSSQLPLSWGGAAGGGGGDRPLQMTGWEGDTPPAGGRGWARKTARPCWERKTLEKELNKTKAGSGSPRGRPWGHRDHRQW